MESVRTTLLNALYSGTRDCPVDGLGSILDSIYGALACDGCGAEEAGLAGNLLTEHVDGVLCRVVVLENVEVGRGEVRKVSIELLDGLLDEVLVSVRETTALKHVDVD